MKLDNKIAKKLDDCLERMQKGESVESCLQRYPEDRHALAPLLETARHITGEKPSDVPAEFSLKLEKELLTRFSARMAPGRSGNWRENRTLAARWASMMERFFRPRTLWVAVPVVLVLMASLLVVPPMFSPRTQAAACVLDILSGSVEMIQAGRDTWVPATDNITLEPGDRVRTVDESYAVLNFTTGSTVTLEPSTEILVNSIVDDGASTPRYNIRQLSGKTWNNAVSGPDGKSTLEIETEYTRASAGTTQFMLEVRGNSALIQATRGTVTITSATEEIQLAAGKRVEFTEDRGAAVMDVPAPGSAFSISVTGQVVMVVENPDGAVTGVSADGCSMCQIPSSHISSLDDTQEICILEPIGGSYHISIYPTGKGQILYSISGCNQDVPVFTGSGKINGKSGDGWLIEAEITVENGLIVSGLVSDADGFNSDDEPVKPGNTGEKDKDKDKKDDDEEQVSGEEEITGKDDSEDQDEEEVEEEEDQSSEEQENENQDERDQDAGEDEDVDEDEDEIEETQTVMDTEIAAVSILTISINGPAYSLVTDPDNAKIGSLPDGSLVNEVDGAGIETTGFLLTITINEPVSGTYRIVVSPFSNGNITYTINGETDEETIFGETALITKGKDKDWIISVYIIVEDGVVVSGTVTGVEEIPES